MKINFILISLVLLSTIIAAQGERETRAVWLTTNYRLDWPPNTFNEAEQKRSLEKIFENIKKKNLNTVYFQVRSNGTVMYNSSYDPWSPYISGKEGAAPSYDPLEFAIKLARKNGLEIHVWVNVVRCFAGQESEHIQSAEHVVNKYKYWSVKISLEGKNQYWLDMGYPEVREYLVKSFTELVSNYDVDGIHLDFIRYPGAAFNDNESYSLYGNGLARDDWRRENLNIFIGDLYKKVKTVKPYVKVGAAPIGIYKNIENGKGFQGYVDVNQDAREWLKRGIMDYVVPQIYWDFERNPKFDVVANDWLKNSFGKSIVLGTAPYKSEVLNEIERMIQFSRDAGAAGVSFFRYQFIADYNFKSFSGRVYPAPMPWIDSVNPKAPQNLTYEYISGKPSKLKLSWTAAEDDHRNSGVQYYSLYKLPTDKAQTDSDYLIDLLDAHNTSVTLAVDKPQTVNYYLTLKSVDKLWNESENSSNVLKVTIPEMKQLADNIDILDNPVLIKRKNGSFAVLFFSDTNDKVEVILGSGFSEQTSKSVNVSFGNMIIELEPGVDKFDFLKIKFVKSGKEHKLLL
ncbi:MAG: family 10 glycosylhydrolase [Melioribacteraceae bacterium]|nr:family 10 glycosylhydrolase [Melioribacteraceae bacterium]MCF8393496.1 family 10 glycosylhydrolase [Melioribacteraceae bacterium]MCF8419306.1 family 10 glycosylhydrolase [Melioribacteraceae bacterium]